ncbi:MAG: hypothetical protein WD651_15640 [Acidimicrobiia bacterium]
MTLTHTTDPGIDGQLVDKALREKAGTFPNLPAQTQGQVLADALTAVCADSLTGGSENHPGREVTVAELFVDANLDRTDGDKGPIAVTHQTEAIPFPPPANGVSVGGGATKWRRGRRSCPKPVPRVRHPPPGFAVLPPTSLRSWGEKPSSSTKLGMTIDPNSPIHRRRLIGWRPTTGPPISFRPLVSTSSPNSNSVP